MDIKCPVCGSGLIYERADDGIVRLQIEDNGKSITSLANKSDGSTYVYCRTDNTHKLSNELIDAVCDIVLDYNY